MKTNNLTFGAKIRELRLKQGLTQSQVAEAVHVSTQAYSRWENDERQPSYEVLAELLFFLGNPEFKIKENKINGYELEDEVHVVLSENHHNLTAQ